MNQIRFKAFDKQRALIKDQHRIKGAFAGKRGGKTEGGAIQGIMYQERKRNFNPNGVDPFLGVIIAPTNDMLRRLSLKKFMAYANPFIKDHNKSTNEIVWHDGSIIYGLSASKPERIEGIKAHWIWLDEVFQMNEQLFLECRARLADTQGDLICTGSLGVQFINPKLHWAHHYFKEKPGKHTSCHEWGTADNPYFPREELEDLKDTLDPQTYRAMFEINWDTVPKTAVFDQFDESNVMEHYAYNPALPTIVAIDWGWAHDMAVGFFQYDRAHDRVYLFDEIIQNKLLIEDLYKKIMAKPYNINQWVCDIAGNQEREQVGISNIQWFKQKGINFKFRRTAVNYGIPIVRSFVRTMRDEVKFYVAKQCVKSIDGMKQYRYAEKDGIIQNENPIKENDDAVDMIRYYFVNCHDPNINQAAPGLIPR